MDKVIFDKMRDEQVLPENRWPYMGSRLPVHRQPPPPSEDGPGRRPKYRKTKAQEARELHVKKKRLETMIAARAELAKDRERVEKQAESSR
eukprot:SAG31_NODE_2940_length_4882_cov_7.133807_6_plen_91_part_00